MSPIHIFLTPMQFAMGCSPPPANANGPGGNLQYKCSVSTMLELVAGKRTMQQLLRVLKKPHANVAAC